MLKGIPNILSADFMKVLMEMGHGDEIVIADGNFPAATCAKRLVTCPGIGVPQVLDAVMKFLPLDNYVEHAVTLMSVPPSMPEKPVIWNEFEKIIKNYEKDFNGFEYIDRFDFYDRAKNAFAVVSTGETATYACIIIKKGVVVY